MKYVLITPARNEAEFIDQTIRAVVSQSVLPLRWIIVSDGSTDRTDEIVSGYLSRYPWIELVRMPERRDRQFAAKVQAFNAGYRRVVDLDFDILGNLDADITFDPDYFEFLLDKFAADPRLGVAGTPFVEGSVSYDYRFTDIQHVSGACQLFRRECFEQIGGYQPIRGGGIDWVAVTSARMRNWTTRTFTDKVSRHHRSMGTGNATPLGACFKRGGKDYYLGGHPLWQLFRVCFQMARPPFIVGGICLGAGYLWAWTRRVDRVVSPELMKFHRAEQMRRLRRLLRCAD